MPRDEHAAGERDRQRGAFVAEQLSRERAHVQHQLLDGERDERVRAKIARCRRRSTTTGASVASCAGVALAAHAMRSDVSFTCAAVRIAPVSAVSGSRPSAAAVDDRQRAAPDPCAAAFVAAHRTPAAAARRRAGRPAPERHRAGAADQQHARAVAERVVERDAEVGMDHELRREIAADQRLPQLPDAPSRGPRRRRRRRAPAA